MSDNRLPSKHWDQRIYSGLLGAVTQNFVEANVKRGLQFFIEEEISMTSLQRKSFVLRSQSKPLIIKYYFLSSDDAVRVTLREGSIATYGVDNTSDIINYNRKEPQPTTCKFHKSPTITTHGFKIGSIRIHSASTKITSSSHTSNTGIELVLPADYTLEIDFENLTNANNLVVFWMTWCEGDTSDNMN